MGKLTDLLGEARLLGFLGPGPVEQHMSHGLAFLRLVPQDDGRPAESPAVDLGSGAGVPGLLLALACPGRPWVLIEANHRRASFLTGAVDVLGIHERVEVACQRAEEIGRSALRGAAGLVVARAFAGPAPTAECAAPLLRPGGSLLVSEPPGAPDRWSADLLDHLGLAPDGAAVDPVALRRFRQVSPCPDRFPRRTGVPFKRPLFNLGSDGLSNLAPGAGA